MCNGFKWIKYLCLIAIAALTSCLEPEESEFEKVLEAEEKEIDTYLQNNNQEATKTESGIYYSVLKEKDNGRKVKEEDIVTIQYKMSTLAGKFIDSASVTSEGESIRFQHIGGSIYPQGINMGVSLMREGEEYRFYVPSVYAFFDYAYQDLVPANAILVADVEVVKLETIEDIKAQEKQAIQNYIVEHQLANVAEIDSGLFYQTVEAGSGDKPKSGQIVEATYKGFFLDGKVFDESKAGEPLRFTIGVDRLIEGFVAGIMEMKKGEKARIFIPSHMAYDGVQVIPEEIRKDLLKKIGTRDWKPFTPIIFEVELLDVK